MSQEEMIESVLENFDERSLWTSHSEVSNKEAITHKNELIKEDYDEKSVWTRHCEENLCTLDPVEGTQGTTH